MSNKDLKRLAKLCQAYTTPGAPPSKTTSATGLLTGGNGGVGQPGSTSQLASPKRAVTALTASDGGRAETKNTAASSRSVSAGGGPTRDPNNSRRGARERAARRSGPPSRAQYYTSAVPAANADVGMSYAGSLDDGQLGIFAGPRVVIKKR